MERIKNNLRNYKAISLFSGIGGLDLGFQYAGFNVIWANDFDKYAVQTYKENVSDLITLGDIKENLDLIPDHDVLLAGFPCQPFSTLGKLKGFEDERGTLFFTIKEILIKHKTKIIVLENVKNMKTHDSGKTFKRMLDELEDLGYVVNHEIMDTQKFDIPQRRNRIFIVAFLKDYFQDFNFKFPIGDQTKLTVQDILDNDVPSKYFISKNMIDTILSPGTKGYIVQPKLNPEIAKTLTATMHKMHRASQDNYYVDIENYEKYHDENKTNIRKLTPNECRKLQGFPSDWRQVVSDTQAYKQFGNAVTVNVAYKVALEIYRAIDLYKNSDW
jgi:DNA (cytosine-5)-methyltransferase 1